MMNRGKIAFGKIGISLAKPKEPEEPAPDTTSRKEGEDEGQKQATTVGFGSFGKLQPQSKTETTNEDETSSVMGFTSFGKKAKEFDIDTLVEETRKSAIDRNKVNLEKLDSKGQSSSKLSEGSKEEPSEDQDQDEDDDDFVGPPLPPGMILQTTGDEEGDSASSDEDEDHRMPISHELMLEHGAKTVSGLAVDPSGSRLVSGGLDYDVHYWDFQGMDQSREAFRSFCPAEGYPVNSVDYSCTGDKVLVVSGSQQAKVYDRDGIELFECAKGDMYLHDMAKTKGHIAGLTCGAWHPKDKEEFLTSARDGTCRIWHTSRPHCQKNVIKARSYSGLKTHPTACTYSRDGLLVACASVDGSIQMWDHRKNFVNVSINFRNAHEKGTETSGLTFSYDNKGFASRGGDDTLKLWDLRNTKQAVHAAEGLFNRFGMTDCIFSPNDQLVLTGTSLNKGEKAGKVIMYNRNTWDIVKELEVGPSHVVRMIWHARLNQLMVGCGDGKVRILYDPKKSHNGAVLVACKHKKRSKQAEVVVSQQIITPHALPMFREERHKSTRKLEERDRKDPLRSKQPDLPVGKAGSGGRVSAGGSTLSSYIIRNMGLRRKVQEEGDPREALLKFAKDAAENPYWVTPAYAKNQPNPIFQDNQEQEEGSAKEETTEPVNKKMKTDE